MHCSDILQPEQAMLLVIDMQTKLLQHISEHERVVACSAALLQGAALFGIPVRASVQYVKGLGETDSRLAELLSQQNVDIIEKPSFSLCKDDNCRKAIQSTARRQILVTGIESHICVQQTVLQLLQMDLQPFVCADAVGSRRPFELETALGRMRQAGAVITTTESALFELCGLSGTQDFKSLLAIIKNLDQRK